MLTNYLGSIANYIPELICAVGMVALLLLDATYKKDETHKPLLFGFAYLTLVAAIFILLGQIGQSPKSIFTGAVMIDSFSTLAKLLMCFGTIFCIYLNQKSSDIYKNLKSEYAVLCIGVLIGGMMLASANNLLIFYLGIETLSILSYVLAALKKKDDRSSEAGLKYALYGGVSAGLMLFGMSHIYGVVGSIYFTDILQVVPTLEGVKLALLLPSFILFFAGIAYKVSCAPFHMWTPDVYEGSPLPVTAFFAIVPKIAGIIGLTRVSMVFFANEGVLQTSWVGLLCVMSVITMFVGNITAIGQKSVKRMLAFSSIGHAGFMMLGIVVLNEVGVRGILFYISTYIFMTLIAFYVTTFVSDHYNNDHFERFKGLMKRYPLMALAMTIAMFSLAGLPPFSGFIAKFNILAAVVNRGFYTVALMAAINSVISIYFYFKIIRFMILQKNESSEEIKVFTPVNQGLIFIFCIPVLVFGVFWSDLLELVTKASIFVK